jgi:hypothetical protein
LNAAPRPRSVRGGTFGPDAGALPLAHTEEAIVLIDRLPGCFIDQRRPDLSSAAAS